MIYPKCLYNTREITKVVQNEPEHKFWAGSGWLDIWTDKEPHKWGEEVVIAKTVDVDIKPLKVKEFKKIVKKVIKKAK